MRRPVDISSDVKTVEKQIDLAKRAAESMIRETVQEALDGLEMVRSYKPGDLAGAERVVIQDFEVRGNGLYTQWARLNEPLPPGRYRIVVSILKRP